MVKIRNRPGNAEPKTIVISTPLAGLVCPVKPVKEPGDIVGIFFWRIEHV